MCAIPQLIPAPLNPIRAIPIVEHFRRSHPQCEHSYWQGIWVGKQPLWQRKCNKLNNGLHYVHFKITGDPCNLIGSQQCDLFYESHYFFALNRICFKSHQPAPAILKSHYDFGPNCPPISSINVINARRTVPVMLLNPLMHASSSFANTPLFNRPNETLPSGFFLPTQWQLSLPMASTRGE